MRRSKVLGLQQSARTQLRANKVFPVIVALLTIAALFSCSRGQTVAAGSEVTGVKSSGAPVSARNEATVNVGFSFASKEVFDGERNVEVVAQLPSSVRYRSGTAELKRPTEDREIVPQEIVCKDGSSYLIFDLSPVELVDSKNVVGKANGEIRFTVDGTAEKGPLLVSAAASQDMLPATCGVPFPAQLSTTVGIQ